jgi:2,4-dichlorophenol 6-monooxygenase
VSTLDLVGKGQFTLLTGLSGQAWVTAASSLALQYLRTVVIGSPEAQDLYFTWHRAREMHEAGVLLVRPDGVVAWRHCGALWDGSEATRLITEALNKVLDLEVD